MNDPDIIWREDFQNTNSLEVDNFPPSLLGNGRINPSQNFVNAFPMADEDNNCTIVQTDDSDLPVTGSGEFVVDGDECGDEKRDVIHLKYDVNDGVYIHSFVDTLVFRDKAVTFEEFQPVVIQD